MLTDSVRRKVVVTCGAMLGFALLWEASVFDSRSAQQQARERLETASPAPGRRLRFMASAYCKGDITSSGVPARTGVAAADPALLPVGSVVQLDLPSRDAAIRYNGIYTIMDTGPAVSGRELDLFMADCEEARRFGLRKVQVVVLRLGWNPRASSPGVVSGLIRERERALEPAATPSPAPPPGPVPSPAATRPPQ